jgi:serine/threonine protein kinase/DNA-binding NarL/FixJ family response regulator
LHRIQAFIADVELSMPTPDPAQTQRPATEPIVAELARAGFEDARLIGKGGFGAVYRCVETGLDRTVAIKVLHPNHDEEDLTRFLREQRAMGRLMGHPNIVGVLYVDVTDRGEPFIVMPYHARGSIHDRIRDSGPLSTRECLRLSVKIAGALETAHAAGILHRDVKPANILVSAYGEPQLADFGIARVEGSFKTSSGLVTASPAYAAPEVLAGRPPTIASDIYGLAATVFCALTGHAAYERREGERIVTQFLRVADRVRTELDEGSLPTDLISVIEQAMAPEASARQSSAAEFGQQLQDVQESLGLVPDSMIIPAAEVGDEAGSASSAQVDSPADVGKRGRRSTGADEYRRSPSSSIRSPRNDVVGQVLMNTVRVVVADDDVLLREGLASLLERSGFDVVGQAGDARQLLDMVRATQPQLAVVDIRMPPTQTSEGLDAARIIRAESPDTAILVLSAHVEVEHATELLAGGRGIGYLLKSRVTDVDDFVDTVQRVAAGASVVDPALVAELVSAQRRDDPLAALSPREREVLTLMAEGLSNAGIGRRLWVTEGTVEKHVRSILTKLNLPETGDDHRRVRAVIVYLEAR